MVFASGSIVSSSLGCFVTHCG
ncbi:hypothetical protein Gotri_007723 [Gossypium trilobum]|uniref:Uncharacterized protein n=1 Tax=Gossypium trilobum TaxID=34281 RepID=A0A7J9EHH7_9ROSI|nr:hypothetical protein [Gossypium trilobum]